MAGRLLGLVAGLVAFAVVHSVLAAPRVRERGEAILGNPVRYRFLYSVVAVVLMTAVLVATRGSYPIVWETHGFTRAALLAVQGIAVIGFILTVRSFEVGPFLGLRARSTAAGAGAAPEFRVHGPYARCRHPLYFFTNLFFSAWPVMDLRWLLVALWLWGYAYVGSILEERKLVQELGDAYRAYQARMPRFLPLGPRRRLRPYGRR